MSTKFCVEFRDAHGHAEHRFPGYTTRYLDSSTADDLVAALELARVRVADVAAFGAVEDVDGIIPSGVGSGEETHLAPIPADWSIVKRALD